MLFLTASESKEEIELKKSLLLLLPGRQSRWGFLKILSKESFPDLSVSVSALSYVLLLR